MRAQRHATVLKNKNTIIKLYNKGQTVKSLAIKFECSADTIRLLLIRNNIKLRNFSDAVTDKYSPLRRAVNNARNRAKIAGWDFEIDIFYMRQLFDKQGGLCPLEKRQLFTRKNSNIGGDGICLDSASIDRIDNTKGYIKGNVRWVTWRMNCMKGIMSDKEFKEACQRVVSNSV